MRRINATIMRCIDMGARLHRATMALVKVQAADRENF